jgi:peptidoglycan/LPS O-acetylase OafA/YrhL
MATKIRKAAAQPAPAGPPVSRDSPRFYLPQLDGWRFVAFLMVFIHHLPDEATVFFRRVELFGWMGVDLFFCLSAFLITSLLLREQAITGTISLRRFYIRRALRIWPLYFLTLALVFLGLPALHSHLTPEFGSPTYLLLLRQHLFPFLAFLGNFSWALFPASTPVPLAPLWSVSVEEQFYLFWPLLLTFLPRVGDKTSARILGVLLAFTLGVRVYILLNGIPYPMVWVNTLGRLDPFLFGTAVALLYAKGRRVLPAWLASVASVALFALVMQFPQVGDSFHTSWQLLAVAAACALLLHAVLHGRMGPPILGNAALRWAGKLSYGLYMFHRLGQDVAAQMVTWQATPGTSQYWLAVAGYTAAYLAVTAFFAAVSYYGLELSFLHWKERFTVVASRPA